MNTAQHKDAPKRRTRLVIGGVITAAGIVVLPQLALGAADTEPTYTGCLRTAGNNVGTLAAIAPGSEPTRECNGNEKQINVSGGDITAVSAGTGIELPGAGGFGITDTQGNVQVGIAPKYRLPQNCLTGELVFARPGSTGNKWGCTAPPPDLPRTVVAHRIAPNGSQYIGADGKKLATISLGSTPSAWVFNVRIAAEKDRDSEIDDMILNCDLWVTGRHEALDSTELFQDAATSTYYGQTVTTLAGAAYLPADGYATVSCADGGRDMRWTTLVITAIPVENLSVQ